MMNVKCFHHIYHEVGFLHEFNQSLTNTFLQTHSSNANISVFTGFMHQIFYLQAIYDSLPYEKKNHDPINTLQKVSSITTHYYILYHV